MARYNLYKILSDEINVSYVNYFGKSFLTRSGLNNIERNHAKISGFFSSTLY